MRPLHRRLATAAVVPLIVLSVAGCGPKDDKAAAPSDTTSASSTDSTADAAAETDTDVDADRADTTATSDTVGGDVDATEFAKRLEVAFTNIDTAAISLEMTSAGLVMTATGEVDYTGDSPTMSMTMSAPAFGDQAIEALLVDGSMYMALPMLGNGSDDTFFKIDLDDPDNPLVASMGGLSSFDPKATVEMFGQGLEEVTFVGDDSVDGVSTKHYLLSTNTDSFKSALGDAADVVPQRLEYDVWLDDQGRLAKMEADLAKQGSMTLTMSKWGEPVSIKAPAENKIQTFPNLPTRP